MGARANSGDSQGGAVLELEREAAAPQLPEEERRLSLEELLAASAVPDAAPPADAASTPTTPTSVASVRTARVLRVAGRSATIALRGATAPVQAEIAPEVDPEIIADAAADGGSVLIELGEGETPLVVAALQTRKPREIRLRATTIHIEGDEEVLLRSGRGAVRIRADGDIEVIGSRISAASRGLFRIVGRLLRLN